MRHLNRMSKHVLAVTRPIIQAAKQRDKLLGQINDTNLIHRLLAHLSDMLIKLGPRLFNLLLNLRRLDTPIFD